MRPRHLLIAAFLFLSAARLGSAQEITVAAAADLQFAFQDRRRIPLGGRSRPGEIFRSSQSRPSVSGGGQARGRQANAQVNLSVSGGRCNGGWIGESGG